MEEFEGGTADRYTGPVDLTSDYSFIMRQSGTYELRITMFT
jgi:hypothetical protein